MSAQIDIILERREPGQGSWLAASTSTSDDRYRLSARSVNLTWRLRVKTLACPFPDELATNTEAKRLPAGLLLLAFPSREDTEFFCFSARTFLETMPIDIQYKITVYKKVIIFLKAEGIL